MIVIKRPIGFTLVLQASNAAAYPLQSVDPLNADVYYAYKDEPTNRRYVGTFPIGSKVKIPLPPDQDRDVVVTAVARSGVGVQHVNDVADGASLVVQSEREQRKPIVQQMGAATNLRIVIGISYYPRHMRARRIQIATDAGFTSIIATWFQDVDRANAETPRLPEQFAMARTVPGLGNATYYVRVAHSSFSTLLATDATYQLKLENLRWGPNSDPLTVTFADLNEAGGSSGSFNPFTATFQGYGASAADFAFTVPMPEATNSGGVSVTGLINPFMIPYFVDADTITGSFFLDFDQPNGIVRAAGGFSGTQEAFNVKTDYKASGSAAQTTGGITALTNTLTVASSSHEFRPNHGIRIAGAGASGADLITTVQAVSSNGLTITLNATASTTVAGAAVEHEDSAAVQAAVAAAVAAGGGTVFFPAGTYRITDITLSDNLRLLGEHWKTTVLTSKTNAPILNCSSTAFNCEVGHLKITGQAGLASQTAIKLDGTQYSHVWIHDVIIDTVGGDGIYVAGAFSSSFERLHITWVDQFPVHVNAPQKPNLVFRDCYVHFLTGSKLVGYRIKQASHLLMENCNGVDNAIPGSVWARVGKKTGVDGDIGNATAYVRWVACNFEAWRSIGIDHLSNSFSDFDKCYFAAWGADTNLIGIQYEVDSGIFPAFFSKGSIDDRTVFANGDPAPMALHSQWVHSNDTPPLMTQGEGPQIAGVAPLSTYYDTGTARAERLPRADGFTHTVTVTGTTVLSRPTADIIELNHSAPSNVTIPWAAWSRRQRPLIIKDVSAAGCGTNNVVIYTGSGGTIEGDAGFVMNRDGQCLILVPDGNTAVGDWRIASVSVPKQPVTAVGGGGDYVAAWNAAGNELTTAPAYRLGSAFVFQGGLLWETDNANDIGAASSNRPRDTWVGRRVVTPKVELGSGGATLQGGSGDPEGSVAAEPGSIYLRTNGSWYKKSTGSGNTGWVLANLTGVTSSGSGGDYIVAWDAAGATITTAPAYRLGSAFVLLGGLLWQSDATDDVGSSASNRPRDVYIGRDAHVTRDLKVSRRFQSAGSAPSTTTGTGAGTSPTFTIDGNDIAGFIEVQTGTSPATNAKIFDVTVSAAFTSYPVVILTPANAAAAALTGGQAVFVSDTDALADKWTVKSGSSALAASTTYQWYYHCIGV